MDELIAKLPKDPLQELISNLNEQIIALETENRVLRGVIANADLPCMYCGLSKADMGKCAFGFPGCGRGDDMANDPNWSPEIGNVTL